VTIFDYGIDGEVEFKDDDGQASGKRIYVQLKSGNSYLRTRTRDGSEVFDVKNDSHLEYWISQPVDVYLVIRQTDETRGKPNHPLDERNRIPESSSRQNQPSNPLRRREARHGSNVASARPFFPRKDPAPQVIRPASFISIVDFAQ